MRLVDLDNLDLPGKTQILKVLDRYEKEHPITKLTIQQGDGWEITMTRKVDNADNERND